MTGNQFSAIFIATKADLIHETLFTLRIYRSLIFRACIAYYQLVVVTKMTNVC